MALGFRLPRLLALAQNPRRRHLLRLLEASLLSFFQTHVVGNKGTCRFYYIAAAAGPRRGPQGRDEEIGDVAAYVIDQANGDKWDD